MPSFKDARQREWLIELDAPIIRRVRTTCDVDLADLDGKAVDQLQADPCLLVDVLYVICREQAQAKQVSDEEFGKSLVGEPIEHATDALVGAIADFFPPRKREMLRAIVAKNDKMRERAMELALAKINDPALEDQIIQSLEQRIDDDVKQMLTRLTSATNSPDSSASTPAD